MSLVTIFSYRKSEYQVIYYLTAVVSTDNIGAECHDQTLVEIRHVAPPIPYAFHQETSCVADDREPSQASPEKLGVLPLLRLPPHEMKLPAFQNQRDMILPVELVIRGRSGEIGGLRPNKQRVPTVLYPD